MIDVVFAQLQRRDRSGEDCVADNGICPDWIADNLDRYVDPFWQHVYLTLVSLAIGFAIAFALALLAHRRRWLITPIVQITGILYTLPSVAVFFLLLPLTGRGNTTAIIALVALLAADPVPQLHRRLRERPRRGARRGARHGADAAPAAVAGRAAARAAGDHGRAADRRHDHWSASPRSSSWPAPAASARRCSPTSTSAPTCSWRAAWPSCSRSCSTC